MAAASIIGLALTAISLGLTIYVLRQARTVQEEAERLRNRFLFQQRAPDFIRNLEEVARYVNLCVKAPFPHTHELRSELMGCAARLEAFESKLSGAKNALQRSKDVRRQIENALQGTSVEKEQLQDIYEALYGLNVATQELFEDRMSEV